MREVTNVRVRTQSTEKQRIVLVPGPSQRRQTGNFEGHVWHVRVSACG